MKPGELARQMRSEANRLEERAATYDEIAQQLRGKAESLRRRANRMDKSGPSAANQDRVPRRSRKVTGAGDGTAPTSDGDEV